MSRTCSPGQRGAVVKNVRPHERFCRWLVNTGQGVAYDLFPTKTAGHKIVVDHTSKYALFLQDENQVGVKVQLPFGDLKMSVDGSKKSVEPTKRWSPALSP
jgi:hypothetical protein